MEEIKHKLFYEILVEDQHIQRSVLGEIFKTVDLTADFTGATKIIERVFQVYSIACKIHDLPYRLKNEYENICIQLKRAIDTDCFQNSAPSINTHKNEILLRIGDYPLSALLAAPISQTSKNQTSKKYLLDLLTFILIEIKRKQPSKDNKIIENAATLLRKYAEGGTFLKGGVKEGSLRFTQIGILIERIREKSWIPFERQFANTWSKVYELLNEKKHAEKDDKTPFVLLNKTKIRPYIVFTNDDNIDAEDAFTEMVEVTSVNEEVSFQTKKASYLYGNQLSTPEKMHLPYRTNSLSNKEAALLVEFLNEQLTRGEEISASILVSLVILTSRNIGYCQNLKIYTSGDTTKPDEDFIDLTRGVWVRKSIQMPMCYTPSREDNDFLKSYQSHVSLPLTAVIISALITLCEDRKHEGSPLENILKLNGSADENVTTILNKFASNQFIYRKITAAACRVLLFDKLNDKFDGAYASLVLANTEYDTTTSLYYISASVDRIANDYVEVAEELGFEYKDASAKTSQDINFSGSQMPLSIEKLALLFKKRRQELLTLIDTENLSIEDTISRFNAFSCYTALLFMAATAHRPRIEFGFTKYTIDEKAGYILLSDKAHHHESACRIIPLCESMKIQLQAYRNFAKVTAKLLKQKEPNLAKNIASIYNEYDYNQPFLCLIDNNKHIKAIGKSIVEVYLAPEFNLPLNFFRHLWSFKIRENGEFKHLKSLMGHIASTEHLLSNYSCASISDITSMAAPIDTLLTDINLQPIDIKPVKGPCVQVPINQEVKAYIPNQLQKTRDISVKEKLLWVRTLINGELKNLKNDDTFEAARDKLVTQALSACNTSIKKHERIYLLNRYLDKIHKNKTWVGLQNNFSDLHMSNDVIHIMRQSNSLYQSIRDWIKKQAANEQTANTHLVKIWFSLIINSKLNVPFTKENLLKITRKPFLEKSICFFELQDFNGRNTRVIVNTCTLLLIKKYSDYRNASQNITTLKRLFKSCIGQILSTSSTRKESNFVKLKTIDDVAKFICRSRNDVNCSLSHTYQNNKIQTTNLPPQKLARWLSYIPLRISSSAEFTESDGLIGDYEAEYNKKANYKKSLGLIKEISANLTAHGISHDPRAKIKKRIISTWANFIGNRKEENVNALIQQSTDIEDVVIAAIVWLIEVSIRPGRQKRKLTALSTVQSYLSIVAKPLLEHAHSTSFFSLDAHEYEEIYIQTLDSRTKKSRIHRAGVFRNFHNFLQQRFDVNSVDWFEIEPNINNKNLSSDANIISIREYQAALTLLANDKELDEYNRNINQIILILCYRGGLRTGEACFLHTDDIDIYDWIIHVRSCYLHRLKTRTSNRRVPVSLLLSNDEKALIKAHIETVKQYYPDNESAWLFSDKTNLHSAKSLQVNLDRTREALRLVSGDNTLKLKHARHSFANYLMLAMNNSFYSSSINQEIKAWARTTDLDLLSNKLKNMLIGNTFENEKVMHAIALIMGHISPETTLKNYIHTLDIFSAAENEKCIYQTVPIVELTNLTDISRTSVYKIVDRKYCKEGLKGYQSITDRIISNFTEVQGIQVEAVANATGLRSLKVKLPTQVIREFNDIERIIRLKEDSLTTVDIAKKLHVDFTFAKNVVDSARSIMLENGYRGVKLEHNSECLLFQINSRNHQTYCKFIRQDAFQALVSKLAKQTKNIVQLEDISHFWLKNYTKQGLLIDKTRADDFLQFIEKLDYKTNLIHEYWVRTDYGKRRGALVKYFPANSPNRKKTDNRIQHLLFLLTLWIDVNNSSRKEAA